MSSIMFLRRTRWSAIGAACAVALGSGGLMTASATISSGERGVFVPISPCRVMDTRVAPLTVGPRSTPLGTGETHTISVIGVNGNCTIPADAIGLSLNVTIVDPNSASFLTVFPADVTRPLASNLNWSAGQAAVPNAVTTDISADGKISFFNNSGTVNVIADIVGYYADHNHDDRYFTKDQTRAQAGSVLVIPSAVLQPVNENFSYLRDNATGLLSTHTAPYCFTAAVDLPNGATITSLTAAFNDVNNNEDGVVELRRDPAGFTGGTAVIAQVPVASLGGPGAVDTTDNTVTTPVVDRNGFGYFVNACIRINVGIYDVRITYTPA